MLARTQTWRRSADNRGPQVSERGRVARCDLVRSDPVANGFGRRNSARLELDLGF